MARRERMSSVDTAWLRMDSPTNQMTIVGVLMFNSPVEFARLKRTLEFRLLHYRRFRQRVLQDASGTWWELDQNFDIDSHVLRVSLPGKAGKNELEAYVAGQISQSLDRGKPLWQFQLVENYHGGAALVARFHHCIADGIALMGVLHSLTDASRDAPEEGAATPWVDDDGGEGEEDGFWQRVIAPLGDTLAKAIRLSGKAGVTSLHLLANPEKVFDRRGHRRRTGFPCDHAGGFADALQGQDRCGEARRLVGADAAWRNQGNRQGAGLFGQRYPALLRLRRIAPVPGAQG
jgi:diacylglycerol O-acyltransferase / wax synthase